MHACTLNIPHQPHIQLTHAWTWQCAWGTISSSYVSSKLAWAQWVVCMFGLCRYGVGIAAGISVVGWLKRKIKQLPVVGLLASPFLSKCDAGAHLCLSSGLALHEMPFCAAWTAVLCRFCLDCLPGSSHRHTGLFHTGCGCSCLK